MLRQWSQSELFCFKDTKNFAALLFFLAKQHAINNSGGQMHSYSRMMQMQIRRRDEHGTHKHAHGSWILRSVSRVRSKKMHSLFCITS